MEMQLVCESVKGVMRQQAMISFLINGKPGSINNLFYSFNVMRVPSMEFKEQAEFVIDDINIANILYSKDEMDPVPPPFNYYKYMGSMTTPPCEEYVVHYVVAKTIEVSTTIISQMRDALEYPDDSDVPMKERIVIDGNNRDIQAKGQREVMFFDRERSCPPYDPA